MMRLYTIGGGYSRTTRKEERLNSFCSFQYSPKGGQVSGSEVKAS